MLLHQPKAATGMGAATKPRWAIECGFATLERHSPWLPSPQYLRRSRRTIHPRSGAEIAPATASRTLRPRMWM